MSHRLDIIDFAKHEFELELPLLEPRKQYEEWQQIVLKVLNVFTEQGHSATSAQYCINLFSRLMQYINIDGEYVEQPAGLQDNTYVNPRFAQIELQKLLNQGTLADIHMQKMMNEQVYELITCICLEPGTHISIKAKRDNDGNVITDEEDKIIYEEFEEEDIINRLDEKAIKYIVKTVELLVDRRPLTPITGAADEWYTLNFNLQNFSDTTEFNKRFGSVMRTNKDNSTAIDLERVICTDTLIESDQIWYTTGEGPLNRALQHITFPYTANDRIKIYQEIKNNVVTDERIIDGHGLTLDESLKYVDKMLK